MIFVTTNMNWALIVAQIFLIQFKITHLVYTLRMFLYVVLDLQRSSWAQLKDPKELCNNILVLINTFIRMSYDNKAIVINNKSQKVYDHDHPVVDQRDEKVITDIFAYNDIDSIANDIGYALTIARNTSNNRIIIISLTRESKNDYLKYLKSAFVAKRYSDRYNISVFSYHRNPTLSEIGYFYDNFALSTFLQILCGRKPQKIFFCSTKCNCHGREILYGLVCPVCLSIYCSLIPICKRCRIRFNFKK
ncbi:RNA polymerase II transcription initiation/nucleotide excision repair factor TFIIH, subunit TFB4 [Trachipleistophora hominis]|uniref:RNA polymerase II transcription initiation/nucleotide excision repair factor TFIIH, subunit TFB4 n=1 Tax=Trachipleistophora hominis TaxID=72359 RepID=L7JTL0_TRAHO|nr:RNA polymerase II transcription initiation/nucleotide excision repair factor TFIIH, subunit TFB4 [Trachipleistophora hominis]